MDAQRARIHGPPQEDERGGTWPQRFREGPYRRLDANLEVIASYLHPEDVLVDVGGGAGRVALPLSLRCREVINVDSSPAMLEEFEALAEEAGIKNARSVRAGWLEAQDI